MNETQEPSFLDISTSYENWKSTFSQILLASNGFKYTGDSDIVQCVLCGLKLGQWKEGDNVQERHLKASPNCKYCLDIRNTYNNRMRSSQNRSSQQSSGDTSTDAQHGQSILRSQFVPSRSESRLPVPVNIIQDNLRGSGPTFRYNPNRPSEQSDYNLDTDIHEKKTMPVAQMARYQEESARLASFENWPDSVPVKPPALARAGLFYTKQSDKVKCPFCLGSMYNWEENDIPFNEHRKHYPTCPFVKYKANENDASIVSTEGLATRPVADANASEPSVTSQPENNTSQQALAAGGKNDRFEDHTSVKIVHDMGFSMEMIRAAVQRIPNLSLAEMKCGSLIDVLYEMEDAGWSESEEEHISGTQSHQLSVSGEGNEEPLEAQVPATSATAAKDAADMNSPSNFAGGLSSPSFQAAREPVSDSPEDVTTTGPPAPPQNRPQNPKHKELSEEHRQLSKRKLCHMCRDDEVSVLFLPCRHLIACETCSATMKDCAQCNKLIIGTVKIYFP